MANPTTIRDLVCCGCGCLCDDLRVDLSAGRPPVVRPACSLGEKWLAEVASWRPAPCLIDGQPVTLDAALDRAAELLSAARAPLVCGLSGAEVNAQRVAVAIAELLGGCIDGTCTPGERAAIETQQSIGAVEASWGEIAQRADLVIFWRCDPAATHPRHLQRYSVEPKSCWLPRGRADRRVVCVGCPQSETTKHADHTIPLTAAQGIEALARLRAALTEKQLRPAEAGFPANELAELAGWIRGAKHAAVFYDEALTAGGPAELIELTQLAQQVQDQTRVVTASLPAAGNAAGASSVLTWQTGFPMAVSFSSGRPEYGPGEFNTDVLLSGGEVDAVLVVADEGLKQLPQEAREQLDLTPMVVLTNEAKASVAAAVQIGVAPLGSTPGGSVFRGDGVALPLENQLHRVDNQTALSHHAVLQELQQRISAKLNRAAVSGVAGAP
ncbi:Formyltransferase/hydrolase complex Fhc subunit B [Posidoniimonas polymericola]|uniref:Formyltransferase/hydrolase complex Fhc subunit B n=1 Tax=Posidoniimonas polymericola TaxID=2528002 RepID=A0A5C5XVF5_9BACT|nr:hypothetical protein [Posidoniimonas polymericola]TWT66874.1 Formyltransferase/hydrolase complex Fhc subunit B [Posidoniimonas polymericola]